MMAMARLLVAAALCLGAVDAADKGGGVKEIRNKNQWDTLLKYNKLVRALPLASGVRLMLAVWLPAAGRGEHGRSRRGTFCAHVQPLPSSARPLTRVRFASLPLRAPACR